MSLCAPFSGFSVVVSGCLGPICKSLGAVSVEIEQEMRRESPKTRRKPVPQREKDQAEKQDLHFGWTCTTG